MNVSAPFEDEKEDLLRDISFELQERTECVILRFKYRKRIGWYSRCEPLEAMMIEQRSEASMRRELERTDRASCRLRANLIFMCVRDA